MISEIVWVQLLFLDQYQSFNQCSVSKEMLNKLLQAKIVTDKKETLNVHNHLLSAVHIIFSQYFHMTLSLLGWYLGQ